MTGWILYSSEDVEKNKNYIQMYRDRFAPYHVELKTVIVDDANFAKQHHMHFFADIIAREQPRFAINRSRNAAVAKQLESLGIRVFNHSLVTEIANDKGATYEYLKDVVPFLPVKYGEKRIVSQVDVHGQNGAPEKVQEVFSYPYVVKSCSGHGGSQVYMVHNRQEEKDAVAAIRAVRQGEDTAKTPDYIVQQCCSDLGKDVRVYVIGNEIVAAVLRTSKNSFKSNYSLGGQVEAYVLNEREQAMVHAITQKLSLDYAGIDFTFHEGQAVFNEIEDAVGARMLYAVTDVDIVQLFVEYIILHQ